MRGSRLIFGFLFALVLIGVVSADCSVTLRSACTSPKHIVIGLSGFSEAHAEIASAGNYNYVLCCDGRGDTTCTGRNKIIGLYREENSHTEIPSLDNYEVDICYDDFVCTNRTNECEEDEFGILSLTDGTNAHLGDPTMYETKICCKEGGCESFTDIDNCLAFDLKECTWTPPGTNTTAQGGGCCEPGEQWSSTLQACGGTANLCNAIWAPLNQIPGASMRTTIPYEEYCAKISRDLSYGFWYKVKTY